jgi:hypothetical protein
MTLDKTDKQTRPMSSKQPPQPHAGHRFPYEGSVSSLPKLKPDVTFSRFPVDPEIQLGFIHFNYKLRGEVVKKGKECGFHLDPISLTAGTAASGTAASGTGTAASGTAASGTAASGTGGTFRLEVIECLDRSGSEKIGRLVPNTNSIYEFRTMEMSNVPGSKVKVESIVDQAKTMYDCVIGTAIADGDNHDLVQYIEVLTHRVVVDNLLRGLPHLNNGGRLVIPIYDSYTTMTWKLFALIQGMFGSTAIVKPIATPFVSGRKYIVADGYNKAVGDAVVVVLGSLEKKIAAAEGNNARFMCTLFDDISIDHLSPYIRKVNNQIMTNTYQSLNRLNGFLEAGDFYGVEYNRYVSEMTQNSEQWKEKFLSNRK